MSTILFYARLECEVGCWYCFGAPTKHVPYNREAMAATMRKLVEDERKASGYDPCVVCHGGEMCMLPVDDLEFFFRSATEIGITPSLQTSTMGMTSEHIRLFKAYNVNVGISVDGPPELNILRGPREPKANAAYQKELLRNMERLKEAGIHYGTISILTKANAGPDKIDTLVKWIKDNEMHGRFNGMFTPQYKKDHINDYELTSQELLNAWLKIAELCLENPKIEAAPIREFIDNLLGYSLSPCIMARCDYINTICHLILPDGQISRCDRCLQEGVYLSTMTTTQVRAEILEQTDCKGCKYWQICGGGCPSEPVDFDVRNKTRFCEAQYGLYEFLEKRIRGLMPNVKLSIDDPEWYTKHYRKEPPSWHQNMDSSAWKKSSKPHSNQQQRQSQPQQQQQQQKPKGHYNHYQAQGQPGGCKR